MKPIFFCKGDDQVVDDIVDKNLEGLIYACDFSADSLMKEELLIKLRQKLTQKNDGGENELSDELLDLVAG